MNTFPDSRGSSAVPSISDLDGYTLRDYNFPMASSYMPPDQDEFGFDPPAQRSGYAKMEQTYSPPQDDSLLLNGWPSFDRDAGSRPSKMAPAPYELDKVIAQSLPSKSTAISRYGQVTPPRSDSLPSSAENNRGTGSVSSKSTGTDRRKRSKAQPKEESTSVSSGRKRKSSRKSAANGMQEENPEESKRKQSLEKNRLAAAKCRVNKKEKTEQLQRDSHDKAVNNAFLKEQIMRMKEEVQQMNAILLAHANCDGCKSPEEIQKHLSNLGNEFFSQHMMHSFDYNQMQMGDIPQSNHNSMMQDGYFASHGPEHTSNMNPPLPDFDRSGEFEVHTPMQTD